jgi:NADPH:quinone reductase-like Zn-dependent oxidoreductase
VRALDLLGVVADQTVLINGAAGGVGTAAVQFARARGAHVIGTASEGNHDFPRTLGAEPTTYGEGMVDRVRQLSRTASIAHWTPPDAAPCPTSSRSPEARTTS